MRKITEKPQSGQPKGAQLISTECDSFSRLGHRRRWPRLACCPLPHLAFASGEQFLKQREKEFEETMDHLQADIDSLESERGELKEKLKNYTKKALIECISKSATSSRSPLQYPSTPSLPAVVRDSPLLIQQIKDMKMALRNVCFFFFQCHHMSFVDFVVLPPGHGRSVTDF